MFSCFSNHLYSNTKYMNSTVSSSSIFIHRIIVSAVKRKAIHILCSLITRFNLNIISWCCCDRNFWWDNCFVFQFSMFRTDSLASCYYSIFRYLTMIQPICKKRLNNFFIPHGKYPDYNGKFLIALSDCILMLFIRFQKITSS